MVARASSVHTPACCRCLWGKAGSAAETHLVVGAGVGSKGWRRPWLLVCSPVTTVSPLQGRTVLEGQAKGKQVHESLNYR